jgi:glycine cleavage system aminomethyltransferase T/glycine/D-amino acid oxidase-like deaminating enzyme
MAKYFPDSARVVVIGGGVMGCSTAYHLAKAGCRDVVLLERKQLTSGTSWHSAAQVRALRSSENLTRMIQYSAELYSSLEAETGQSTGWLKTGSLSLATNEERFTHIKRQASLARLFGVEAEIVSPEEAGRIWPLIRTDDLVGAVWSPEDGRVNPSDLCAALAKGARVHGATIVEDAPVTGFAVRNGRVTGVETERGSIACETVALCAGLWSQSVAALAGVGAPLHACEHFYLLTQPMEEVTGHLPTLGDHDAHLYLRDDVGGLLVGSFEPHARAIGLDKLPKDFAFDLLAEDWDHFEPMLKNGIHRIPALEKAEARMLLNGPESFTPDGRFLLGESPELRGFFLGCGMNSAGMASSGGAGRWLAEWILAGEPTLDLWPVDIRRFAPFHNNMKMLRERAPEVLATHYVTEAPHREFETARNVWLGPLHDEQAKRGAHFGARMGWERPLFFAPEETSLDMTPSFGRPAFFDLVAAEHTAARETIALFDQTSYGKLRVYGKDAEALLQRLCANDMAVPVGRVVYTGMLNARGGYESDCTVSRLAEDEYLIVTGAAQPVRDTDWIRRNMADDEDVQVSDMTGAHSILALAGPNSRDLLSEVFDDDFSDDDFPYMGWRDLILNDYCPVRAARLSYAGELGWEFCTETKDATAIFQSLSRVGGNFGLRHAGTIAMTGLRLEKAYRAWGHELTPETTPLEAGLGFAAKIDSDTPFIGQDALKRQRDEGLRKRIVVFTLDDPDVLAIGGEPVVWNGRFVGQVSSAAYGHTIGRTVALGLVTANGANVDDMVAAGGFEIEIASDRFAATASFRAPYDPSGERIRG